ncbi:MAG: ThiF family adenylyltransferase [Parcubacteria group bacterium]|nr:ThiF family adenylyltransferase [Parcubacteria group bacterium]
MRVKIVGLGGIGCAVLKTLPQFLAFRFPGIEIVLVDGDRFEPKNRDRQITDILGNKAESLAEVLQKQRLELWFEAVPEFLTPQNAITLIREGDAVFLCVDNHATRKLVSDRCQELKDVILISGGNEFTDGNVQVFWRQNGQNRTLPLTSEFHPEILSPADKNPGEMGCDRLAESEPQLLFTNNAVATVMLNAFYAFLEGKLDYDEVYVDILTNNTRQVRRESVSQ